MTEKRVPSIIRAVITTIRRNFLGWATSLYGWGIIIYSGWVVWQVLSQTKLPLVPDEPTLIYLDLLQVMAFLVAWSALVITITIKMVNAKRDIELDSAKLEWRLALSREQLEETRREYEEHRREYEEHLRDHPDIEGAVDRLESSTEELRQGVDGAHETVGRLQGENRLLRQKLSEAGITYEITSSD